MDPIPLHSLPANGLSQISDDFILEVIANRAPIRISDLADRSAQAGDEFVYDVSGFFVEPDSQPLSYSQSGLPGDLDIDPVTGIITATLRTSDVGIAPYNVTITASDGTSSAQGTFTLSLSDNSTPVLDHAIGTLHAEVGDRIEYNASGNFSDPDDQPLHFSMSNTVGNVVIDPMTGIISGPHNQEPGSYSLTVVARDPDLDGSPVSDTFTLSISNNQPPSGSVETDDAQIADFYSFNANALFNDPTNQTLTNFTMSGQPGLLVIDDTSGIISGQLTAGTDGTHSISVTAEDPAGASATATLTLSIAANQSPTGMSISDEHGIHEGDTYERDVRARFSDPTQTTADLHSE